MKKSLEDARPLALSPVEINVAGSERYEDLASMARARKEHIQAALAAIGRDRTEGHAVKARASDAWTVSD